jgi:hypothetical protein
MNQVITDGLILMPPAFGDGLAVWSRHDGTPGSDTYATATNAALVPADQDFGTCLEILKTDTVTTLRYMGETPVPAGTYLRVSVRIKAVSGTLPSVQIGAWAGNSSNGNVSGVPQTGPSVALTEYGRIETVSAIIGLGQRGGVDMVWGETATYGHFGLDLTGANGGTVRIESIQIEDITSVFYRKLMDWVDVKDFGAVGDGVTNDLAAFEAADAAADGREVLVSESVFLITGSLTMDSPVRFQGTMIMGDTVRFALTKNFNLNTYADAFGDEVQGFKKAVQALFNFSDHDALDMNGRRIELDGPIDIQAAVENKTSYANHRVIRNGQFNCVPSSNWDDEVHSGTATWVSTSASELGSVADVANIPIGSLLTGPLGVGREVYVTGKNISAGKLFLSRPLWGAPAQQIYTFRRFKYVLDFSGFSTLQRFVLSDIEFLCAGKASGVLLPMGGIIFHIRDCFFTGPKDRGITSADDGCQGLLIDRNQFLSNEQVLEVEDRTTIAFNVNQNDAKIRDNRAVKFRHFGVLSGTGHLITGNHFFQGDNETDGVRSAGLLLTSTNCKTTVTGNYVDNCYIEWNNEHDSAPDMVGEYSFGGLSIVGNIFMSIGSAPWFTYLHIKPYGQDHYINGMTVTGNVFKQINGQALLRVDEVDDSIAPLDMSRTHNLTFNGNIYHGITNRPQNPITIKVTEATPVTTWEVDLRDHFPFGGEAITAVSVLPEGAVRSVANVAVYTMPYATTRHGVGRGSIRLNWSQDLKGSVLLTARCDTP